MAIPQKIINYLKNEKVKYEPIEHRTVFTAHDKAATLKVKPNIIGKTLVLKADNDLIFVLIPGNKNLDKNKFKKTVSEWRKKQNLKPIKNIGFISEKLMKNKFKGVKLGAIPPFGSLWKVPTFTDRALINQPKIIISSGDYNFSIKINTASFKKIVPNLVIGNFTKAK